MASSPESAITSILNEANLANLSVVDGLADFVSDYFSGENPDIHESDSSDSDTEQDIINDTNEDPERSGIVEPEEASETEVEDALDEFFNFNFNFIFISD